MAADPGAAAAAVPSSAGDAGGARTPLPAEYRERTIPAVLERCVRNGAERPALIATSPTAGEVTLSFGEIQSRAAAIGGGLRELGIEAGDRVGALLSNRSAVEANLLMHGVHRIGAVVVPMNVRSVPAELGWALEAAGCKLVVHEAALAETVRGLRALAPTATIFTGVDGDLEPGDPPWSSIAGHDPVPQVPLSEHDQAGWVFTSGTTGYPKVISHTHLTSVGCGIQTADGWGFEPGDRLLNAFPFFTASGTNTAPMGTLWAEAVNVVEPSFDPATTLERVERHRITHIYWLTPMISLVLRSGLLEGADLSSARRLLYGGQGMPTDFHLQVDDVFALGRGLELVHMMGLSEAGPNGIMLEPQYHRERPGAIGSRGFGKELTQYTLRDPESGEEVGRGESGELCYRCPSVMAGYVGAPEETEKALAGGWLHSGDLCRYDEDGFVYFVDRTKDVIRRGGINIASAEIERVVMAHPEVAEAAAVPHPHDVLGEVVKVVIVRRPGSTIDADAIVTYAETELADYKVPRVVEFIDELPRNDMGKVTKTALRGA
jgi:fatty-acyl-CoA synthase